MPLGSPIPFAEALRSRDIKRILPTPLSSAELAQLPVAIRERSMFSARTMNAHYLEEIAKRVRSILNPTTQIRPESDPHGRGGEKFTDGMSQAQARTELKEILRQIGYAPEPDEAGTLKDLSSDARLNLVLETNVEMAQGYGYWAQGQDAELLELYPAQELVRMEDRDEPRDWPTIWRNAAQTVGDTGAMASLAHGRMVARKDSPIWLEISDFGQPYPPFKFNSGMDVQDVDREEAIALGVIEPSAVVQPQSRGFEMDSLPEGSQEGMS
ncbi:MAG TPA: hypothetical protein VFQ91_25895 [Bryobacteraceae bacterium]|nr:hypothetical protein [Bryobacteraceae bacterium]